MILIPTHLPSSLKKKKKKNAIDNRYFFLYLKSQMGNFQKNVECKKLHTKLFYWVVK